MVAYQVRYRQKDYWMGETVPLDDDETEVEVELLVKIWQSDRSPPGSADEGPYTVEIVSDSDGIGGRTAAVWQTVHGIPANRLRSIRVPVVAGEYIYLKVHEENGKDHPLGDGEDEVDNDTQEEVPDGKRDDMNDLAITSPIWFSSQLRAKAAVQGPFVWSTRTKTPAYYHEPDCWVVENIGQANRQYGPAPAGVPKHDCRPARPR